MLGERAAGVYPSLVRHFFQRFFDNELVAQGAEMRVTVTEILALLALPGLVIPFFLMPRYVVLSFQRPELRGLAQSVDRYFFVMFAMVVVGFVTVLEWDALFPDRRDFRILTTLPIQTRVIFTSKLTALLFFLLLFTVDINGLSTFLFPEITAAPGDSFTETAIRVAIHAIAVAAGSAFIFFFFIALQGVLLNTLSFRMFAKISPAVQFVSMFCLLSLFLLFPKFSSSLNTLKQQNDFTIYLLPPMWFLGLYETLLGKKDPVYQALSLVSLRALALVVFMTLTTYGVSYRRYVRKSLENSDEIAGTPSKLMALLANLTNRFITSDSLERASFYFVGKTLLRSRKHTLYLAAYAGVGFSFVLEVLVTYFSGAGYRRLYQPNTALLPVPLILSFFLLSGMRVVFTVPAELRANWVFRLSEDEERKKCLRGVRKAMTVFAIAPLFLLLFPFYALLWGWGPAALHLIFGLILSVILLELLLLNFHKIPFTCSYLPGKSNMTFTWFLYWSAFTMYAYSMASLEFWMLQRPVRLILFYALALAGWRALAIYRDRVLDRRFTLIYEDAPEPLVQTLELGWRD